MKKVTLQSLSLVNFKGISSLEITFSPNNTFIAGENGTGKTTVFDAFTWLLFGKDSTNRSDSNFNIKTLDENGKPVLHLEHSVTGVLDVDGKSIKLCRKFEEKWTKPRGVEEETLTGHQTVFYVNDVCIATKAEYDSIVRDICNEEVFKMITNPGYFFSLKAEQQKALLLDMAGDIKDEDVAKGNVDFLALVEKITGVGFERYLKELAARKRSIKADIAAIPSNIEALQRVMPDTSDCENVSEQMDKELATLKELDAQIADESEKYKASQEGRLASQKELTECNIAISKRAEEIRNDISRKNLQYQRDIQNVQSVISLKENEKRGLDAQYENLSNRIVDKESEVKALRAEFTTENAKVLDFSGNAFVCPSCHRPLDAANIRQHQEMLINNFHKDKAEKLAEIRARGKKAKEEQDELIKRCNDIIEAQARLKDELDDYYMHEDTLKFQNPEPVNAEKLIETDKTINDLKARVAELETIINNIAPVKANETIHQERIDCAERIKVLGNLEQKVRQAETIRKEIDAFEEKRMASNQALADLEKEECTATEFQKAKDNALMERINGLFKIVKFTFVGEQINGGEKLTCTCLVDGVPYADANNARKINAGLDVINAVCNAQNISAPIFVDNAEAVNVLIPTIGQKIELRVSNDKVITTSVYSN